MAVSVTSPITTRTKQIVSSSDFRLNAIHTANAKRLNITQYAQNLVMVLKWPFILLAMLDALTSTILCRRLITIVRVFQRNLLVGEFGELRRDIASRSVEAYLRFCKFIQFRY